jgi:hypothetical protein
VIPALRVCVTANATPAKMVQTAQTVRRASVVVMASARAMRAISTVPLTVRHRYVAMVPAIQVRTTTTVPMTVRHSPVVAIKPSAVTIAIAAQTSAKMVLAEVISAAYLTCNT